MSVTAPSSHDPEPELCGDQDSSDLALQSDPTFSYEPLNDNTLCLIDQDLARSNWQHHKMPNPTYNGL
jgi:hypothetical protein